MTYHTLKRVVDATGAAVLLLLTLPMLFVVALIALLFQGSPVFFTQLRPGLREKPFRIIKFRTLAGSGTSSGSRTDLSVTNLGAILRRLSIDELPQLLNVLRGEMSFVGPRPLLMEYLPLYTDEQRKRHNVRPGLTGLAQVEGRNLIPWETKLELDALYSDRMSLRLDISILVKSIGLVVRGKGVAAHDSEFNRRFKG